MVAYMVQGMMVWASPGAMVRWAWALSRYWVKRCKNIPFVQLPMPVCLSGVMFAERTTDPGILNSRPPAMARLSSNFPFSRGVWQSWQDAMVKRYLPWARESFLSAGIFPGLAFSGMVFRIMFMGKSDLDSCTAFSMGGMLRR